MSGTHHQHRQMPVVLQLLLSLTALPVMLAGAPERAATEMPTSLNMPQRLLRGGKNLADVVLKIYYINIDAASSRRTWMEQQLTLVSMATKVPHERFSAATREDPWVQDILGSEKFQTSFLFKEKELDIASGTLAAYASHLGLLRRIMNSSTAPSDDSQPQWALILEDDALVTPDDLDSLPRIVNKVPSDAEVIKLGMWGNSRDKDEVSPGIYRATPPSTARSDDGKTSFFYMGAHGYLVRLDKMQSLVAGFEGCAGDNNYWADACLIYGPVSYQLKPSVVRLQEFGSQIDPSGNGFL